MADSSADTTTLVVVAAVVVVAVMWSRRGGMMYGPAGTRPTPGGSSTSYDAALQAARDIFSGIKDAYLTTHSSDPNQGYVEPTRTSTVTSYSDSSGGCGTPGLPPCGEMYDPDAIAWLYDV